MLKKAHSLIDILSKQVFARGAEVEKEPNELKELSNVEVLLQSSSFKCLRGTLFHHCLICNAL